MITPRPHQQEALESIKGQSRGVIHLPTGTGKTVIQAMAIADDIQNAKTPGIYVILAPRIVLANQLMAELYMMLDDRKIETQYLVVHSGRPEDLEDIKAEANTVAGKVNRTTTIKEIKADAERAKRRKMPLIICGTYHSADRIKGAELDVRMLLNDEAHNIVTLQFEWVADEEWSERTYFFTATMRLTADDDGLGMNNEERFGPVLYQRSPASMVLAGEIVRPRLHLVSTEHQVTNDQEASADVATVIDSFIEHRSILNTTPKMLVVTKGTEHLNKIANDARYQALREIRPQLTQFDISSEYGPRINGEVVDRNTFLRALKEAGRDPAREVIILHIDILTEGIDVPGITGVLTFDSMAMTKFIQTVGRASRLHSSDRSRIYSGKLKPTTLDAFIKPYAYVIVPIYGVEGADRHSTINEMVGYLRDYDFNPNEDIIIRKTDGKMVPEPIGTVTTPSKSKAGLAEFAADFIHQFEEKKKADAINVAIKSIETVDDLRAAILKVAV